VGVSRLQPKVYPDGTPAEGILDNHNRVIDESDIKAMYGGGTYRLRVAVADSGGTYKFIKGGSRTVRIAGPPKQNGVTPTAQPTGKVEQAGVAQQALNMVKDNTRTMLDRVDNLNQQRSPQTEMLMEELRSSRESNAELQRLLFSGMNNGHSEKLISQMMSTEASRIESLRAQFESERSAMAQRHQHELDQARATHAQEVRRFEVAQEREVGALQRSYQMQIDTMKISYEGQIASLNRELSVAQGEIAALRAVKDKTFAEQIQEINMIKDLVGGEGDKEASGIERFATAIGGPLMEKVLGGGPAAGISAASMAVAPEPAPTHQIVSQGGEQILHRPDGRKQVLREKGIHDGDVSLSDKDLLTAEKFLAAAFYQGHPPEVVASSVSTMFSGVSNKITHLANTVGIDSLLMRLTKIAPESPLLGPDGREWFENVAKSLA